MKEIIMNPFSHIHRLYWKKRVLTQVSKEDNSSWTLCTHKSIWNSKWSFKSSIKTKITSVQFVIHWGLAKTKTSSMLHNCFISICNCPIFDLRNLRWETSFFPSNCLSLHWLIQVSTISSGVTKTFFWSVLGRSIFYSFDLTTLRIFPKKWRKTGRRTGDSSSSDLL